MGILGRQKKRNKLRALAKWLGLPLVVLVTVSIFLGDKPQPEVTRSFDESAVAIAEYATYMKEYLIPLHKNVHEAMAEQ